MVAICLHIINEIIAITLICSYLIIKDYEHVSFGRLTFSFYLIHLHVEEEDAVVGPIYRER